MLVFVLIGLSLVLLGIVGLQFMYMFYVERMYKERRKHIQTLEDKAEKLSSKLEAAQKQIVEKDALIKDSAEMRKDNEVWAEVIDER